MVLAPRDDDRLACRDGNLVAVETEQTGARGDEEDLLLVRVDMQGWDHEAVVRRRWARLAGREGEGYRRLLRDQVRVVGEGDARSAVLHRHGGQVGTFCAMGRGGATEEGEHNWFVIEEVQGDVIISIKGKNEGEIDGRMKKKKNEPPMVKVDFYFKAL